MATLGGTEEVQYSWSELGTKHGDCLWSRYEESVSGVHTPFPERFICKVDMYN